MSATGIPIALLFLRPRTYLERSAVVGKAHDRYIYNTALGALASEVAHKERNRVYRVAQSSLGVVFYVVAISPAEAVARAAPRLGISAELIEEKAVTDFQRLQESIAFLSPEEREQLRKLLPQDTGQGGPRIRTGA